MALFEWQSEMGVSSNQLFDYHAALGAFERLAPPWNELELLKRQGSIRDGDLLEFLIRKGPLRLKWRARHRDYKPGIQFVDVQEKGPFARWEHAHYCFPSANGSHLVDRIQYQLPCGKLGQFLLGSTTRKELERLFRFRHRRTRNDLERHAAYASRPRLRLLFVGKMNQRMCQLASFLATGGHQIYCIRLEGRDQAGPNYSFPSVFGGPPLASVSELDALLYTSTPIDTSHFSAYLDQRYEFLDKLSLMLEQRNQTLDLMLTFPPAQRSFESLANNPSLDFRLSGEELRDRELREASEKRLLKCVAREIRLHPAHLIQAPLERMIHLLMKLESFVFLGADAQTVTFPWISAEDFHGAVLFLLQQGACEGDLALQSPMPATRNQLQQLVVEENLWTYTLQRVMKVLPWTQPGRQPDLGQHLALLPQIADLGFQFLAPEIEESFLLEMGLSRSHSLFKE